MSDLQNSSEFQALRAFSARIGADTSLIQAAGGNTSVKDATTMWIKASGTQLKESLAKDIFVPVDWRGIADAVTDDPARADQPDQFQRAKGLRPSIETCLHAVLPQPVVIHVHCVNTIALAVRSDAEERIAERLQGLDWALVPYVKPGARLAAEVKASAGKDTNVFVLCNHGLLLAEDTVAGAERLLRALVARLRSEPDVPQDADMATAARLLESAAYEAVSEAHLLHHLARDPERIALATGGGLYPDQVLFCGPRVTVLLPDETVDDLVARVSATGNPRPVVILVPGKGALIARDASATELAMALSVGDVMMRVPRDAAMTYISDEESAALLNWDAEKYRFSLSLDA